MTAPKMERRHFEFIADTVAGMDFYIDNGNRAGGSTLLYVAESMAERLAATNPNFDREKFIRRATEGR